jgi:hypothetical protein
VGHERMESSSLIPEKEQQEEIEALQSIFQV